MKVTQDVREYAAREAEVEAGMAGKSSGFQEHGGKMYLAAMQTRMTAE